MCGAKGSTAVHEERSSLLGAVAAAEGVVVVVVVIVTLRSLRPSFYSFVTRVSRPNQDGRDVLKKVVAGKCQARALGETSRVWWCTLDSTFFVCNLAPPPVLPFRLH